MSRRCFHRAVVMLAAAVVLAGCSLRTAEKVDVLVVGGAARAAWLPGCNRHGWGRVPLL